MTVADQLRDFFARDPRGAVAVYLFGSEARGTARASSDVDVGVLLEAEPPRTLEGLRFDLQDDLQAFLRRTVDLVVINRAPPDLVHRVLRDGVLVLDRDRARRIGFEIATRNARVTDEPLLAKKLVFIEACVRDLGTAHLDEIDQDLHQERFVEYTLQLAIQAALDAASHIVSDERLGEPATNTDLFDLLARDGWITSDQVASLRRMAGLRNILVHGYADVDVAIVKEVARDHLGDLLDFVASVRARL